MLTHQAAFGQTPNTQQTATRYLNGINESSWHSELSVFECTLVHSVPYYGDMIFQTRAGEKSAFYLQALSSRFQAGQAELVAKAPIWRAQDRWVSLGQVPIKRGHRPLWLNTGKAEKMLSELNQGMEIAVINEAWYEKASNPPIQLEMTTIGFKEEYQRYLGCLSGLIPESFEQLKRTSLYFAIGLPKSSDELPKRVKRKLDNMLILIKHDKTVKEFYVDGHASAPGTRADNLALSKVRAELVAEYLTRRGVPKEWITVRWHGERYPVVSNSTRAGRAKNRRVTVRLEREKTKLDMQTAATGM